MNFARLNKMEGRGVKRIWSLCWILHGITEVFPRLSQCTFRGFFIGYGKKREITHSSCGKLATNCNSKTAILSLAFQNLLILFLFTLRALFQFFSSLLSSFASLRFANLWPRTVQGFVSVATLPFRVSK